MFRRAWEYISSIGIHDEYDDILVKRIVLTNRFSVIAILVFLFSGINNLVLGDLFSGLLIEALVIVCLLGFYLNKIGLHRFAISFLFVVVSLAIFYFDSYSGILSGTYLYHFPLILAIAFIFDMREDKRLMLFHILLIIAFLSINVITHHELFRSNFLTDEKRSQMFMFNLIFSASAVGFFVYIMIQNNLKESYLYIQRIEERRQSEKAVKEALDEKNILISELHHRVKNNLAIISGLFSLKINDDLHEDAKNVLLESRNRVRSMALIHNRLYKSDNMTNVNFEEYAKELISEISASYPAVANSVKIDTDIKNVSININSAIPCGLILNELLTNAYKHAFRDKTNGHINVSFINDNNAIVMRVEDNGVGLPEDYKQKQSLGVTVIESLSEQLDGSFNFSNNNGTCFELRFKYN
ncbi:MAG: sensor histidine kinase [Bacteroidetes bacterium]|jgi:two-component sensor histidine kinase|nr:sensor histidine kinase [Bacteroidota bacterium]